jgi:hypothetical protein
MGYLTKYSIHTLIFQKLFCFLQDLQEMEAAGEHREGESGSAGGFGSKCATLADDAHHSAREPFGQWDPAVGRPRGCQAYLKGVSLWVCSHSWEFDCFLCLVFGDFLLLEATM